MSLIERWSNNVINIEYLKKFLKDDTLNKDNIKKSSDAIKIINQFLRKILGKNVSYNNKRSYQILDGKNKFTFIQGTEYDFLSTSNKIIIRNNCLDDLCSKNNFFEYLKNSLPNEYLHKLSEDAILTQLTENLDKFNRTDLENYLLGKISNPKYNETGKLLSAEVYQNLHKVYSELSIISEKLDINIMFIMPRILIRNVNISENSLILSKINEDRITIGLMIYIPGISEATSTIKIKIKNKSITKQIPIDRIYFESIYELNISEESIDNMIKKFLGKDITRQIINHKAKNIKYIFNEQTDLGDDLVYNPLDRQVEDGLNVIEIDLGNGDKRRFLLGTHNHLYEDDDNLNNLVGKLVITDTRKR